MSVSRKRVVVVGAGPMGLAAALGAVRRGFDATVLERGAVGESMRGWGETRLFTPFSMNVSSEIRDVLGGGCPPEDALLTGPEMADRVLVPVAASPPLSGRVRERCAVVAVGRDGLTRTDFARHPVRGEKPFRILVECGSREEFLEADVVLDASGCSRANFAGRGGLPVPGERALGTRIVRTLGELAKRRGSFAGKAVLVVGHGHSAAHAVLELAGKEREEAVSRVVWAVRIANRRPCEEVARDPLPERERVARSANDLAADPPSGLSLRRRTSLAALGAERDRIRATFSDGDEETVDEVVALTGYRPDFSHLSELALELSPVTGGGGRLARALAGVSDCLSTPSVRADDLASGEPGFFFAGSAGYGRNRTFLMRSGLAQIETILDSIA